MLKLIIGVKGTGKTKTLINMVNTAVENSRGNVVCIEKGVKLRYDVKYRARLINTEEYQINDAKSLYGFVAGILASNHDVTDLFVDSALKICKNDLESFDTLVADLDNLVEKVGVNLVITSAIPAEEASETVKKYL
jgi:ABC-type branched-subunit amino acid transport system ATPase component